MMDYFLYFISFCATLLDCIKKWKKNIVKQYWPEFFRLSVVSQRLAGILLP